MDTFRLTNNPSIGCMIAQYIAETSLIEISLSGIFAEALDDNGVLTQAIFHRFQRLSQRIEVVENIISNLDDRHHLKKAIDKNIIQKLKNVIELRNKFAHGVYMIDKKGSVYLCMGAVSERKFKRININIEFLVEELNEVIVLNNVLSGLGLQRRALKMQR
ncbi:hypothetical protein [Stappia indica]|uniref:hypothetical protein n=1 Tax=Stappia indica TaxID=538381 RepID=UPI001D1988F6|nr:hypothetical protein [Stappia indica]MCC4246225.1 hypothetical protein [Stappia indica]